VLTKNVVIVVYLKVPLDTTITNMVENVVRIPQLRMGCDVIKCNKAQCFAMGRRQMKIVAIPYLGIGVILVHVRSRIPVYGESAFIVKD
jgi:hypothetical protein